MSWKVIIDAEFAPELRIMPTEVRQEVLAMTDLLELRGPLLGRPHVDTLKDSRHANMKEMRFNAADGVWRVAFAFDPNGASTPN